MDCYPPAREALAKQTGTAGFESRVRVGVDQVPLVIHWPRLHSKVDA